jgi:hypothetical protein
MQQMNLLIIFVEASTMLLEKSTCATWGAWVRQCWEEFALQDFFLLEWVDQAVLTALDD